MEIMVRSFAMIREAMGAKQVVISIPEKSTVKDLLEEFIQQYPTSKDYLMENGEISSSFIFVINKAEVQIDTLSIHLLKAGDELAIVPPAGGG